ncbi:hypothetical protein BDP27DRAFT_1430083 [Rhodocollybia butyracea]|uniref:Uncharacterized protein n=1 Tax=Rhodocollybia butyracea TaxID=206335 RepID=A0A9P5PBK7_9AGAR|nr:hypothetical protein BDP27DRAFT_1430083 [Rhodocollybia butyracea]
MSCEIICSSPQTPPMVAMNAVIINDSPSCYSPRSSQPSCHSDDSNLLQSFHEASNHSVSGGDDNSSVMLPTVDTLPSSNIAGPDFTDDEVDFVPSYIPYNPPPLSYPVPDYIYSAPCAPVPNFQLHYPSDVWQQPPIHCSPAAYSQPQYCSRPTVIHSTYPLSHPQYFSDSLQPLLQPPSFQ